MTVNHLDGTANGESIAGPVRDEPARLEWMRSAARQPNPRAHDDGSGGERGGRITDLLAPLRDDVAPDLVVQDRRAGREAGVHVDDRWKRLVLDANQIDGVVCAVRVVGDDHRDGLADEAHTIGGEWPDTAGHGQRRMRR